MRLASLEMPISGFEADDTDPSAVAFSDRLLPVERPDSFDQRFRGLVVRSDTGPAMIGEREEEAADTARRPSMALRRNATGPSAIERSIEHSTGRGR
jgi:hypothetical protein